MPSSPEEIAEVMTKHFVKKKLLHKKYPAYYESARVIAKEIVHGKRREIAGKELDELFAKTDDFLGEMARLVDDIIYNKSKK